MSHAVTLRNTAKVAGPNPAVGITGVLEKTEKQVDEMGSTNRTL